MLQISFDWGFLTDGRHVLPEHRRLLHIIGVYDIISKKVKYLTHNNLQLPNPSIFMN